MKTSASYSISSVNDGEKGQDYNHYKGDWFISSDGVGYDFSFPPVPIGMNDIEVKINQNDLEGSVRILCNSNVVTAAINGADGIKEWKSFKINNSFVNTNSDNIIRIEHIAGASADWGHIFEVVFLFSKTGVPGIKGDDGDLGILTLSYSSTTISLQGNGKTQGYIIFNNQKFYLNSTYSFITKGDGVIIVDISTSTPTVTYKKLIIVNEMLVFVDFNTGLEPLSKADVDSNWQYLLIGEFSCVNAGTILNASLKPVMSVTTFLSNEFTSILKQKATSKEKIFEWAKAMGCESYYNVLAASQLFLGQMFANEIILTNEGSIHTDFYLSDGSLNPESTAGRGLFLSSTGLAKLCKAVLDNVTLTSGAFLSDEFSTSKAGASPTSLNKIILESNYTCSQKFAFFNQIIDKVRVTGIQDATYTSLGIIGGYKNATYTSVRTLNSLSRSMNAIYWGHISNNILTIGRDTTENIPYSTYFSLYDDPLLSSNIAYASYSADSWAINNVPTYLPAKDLIDDLKSNIPVGNARTFTGTLTIKYAINSRDANTEYINEWRTFTATNGKILIESNSLTLFDVNNSLIGSIESTNCIKKGTSLIATVDSSLPGIKTMNILPYANSQYDIGTSNNKFHILHANEIHGKVYAN